MNERNVKALADILNSNTLFRYTQQLDSLEELAAYLASRGVLVPASLTDENADEVYWKLENTGSEAIELVPVLERIAKGEA